MSDPRTIQDLCDAAVDSGNPNPLASIVSLTVAIQGCQIEALLEKPLAVFRKFLQLAKIPKYDEPLNAQSRKTVRTAVQCLRGLAATHLHFPKKWDSLIDNLISIWPLVWDWILYLHWHFLLTSDEADKPFPLLALTSISEIVTYHTKVLRLRTVIVQFPGFFHVLITCWCQEAQNPSLNTGTPITGALVCCSSEVFKDETPDMFCTILQDNETAASAAVQHLLNTSTRSPTEMNIISADIDCVYLLSTWDSLSVQLLERQSIGLVTQILFTTILTCTRPVSLTTSVVAMPCLISCYRYLRRHLESFDSSALLVEAIGEDLLSALLSTNSWISELGDQELTAEVTKLSTPILTETAHLPHRGAVGE